MGRSVHRSTSGKDLLCIKGEHIFRGYIIIASNTMAHYCGLIDDFSS